MRTDEETGKPEPIYLKDYAPPAFRIETVDLTFQIFEGETTVIAKTAFKRQHDGPLILDGEYLELVSLTLNGEQATYSTTDKNLTIESPPNKFTLEIVTKIKPEDNTALSGLYKSGAIYCTQCEAEGFRRITYFIDRPDNMSMFTTRIEADKITCPVLLSNGNKIDEGELENGRHYATWEDPFVKPCYLFALVAGDLVHIHDTFTTISGRNVDLYIYVDPGNEDKCDHAMRALKNAMRWDEETYGREYDLDLFNIVAVDAFNYGAMENKSLNIFNSKAVLAKQDTATDLDFLYIEGVVAHEYFHNWTGNRITCRDWFQLSLKEGLTVFRDQSFSADMNSAAVQRIDDVDTLRSFQFIEDSGPLAHPVRPDNYIEINNFYTATVYEKGAEVLRMLHTLLGPELYRKATDLYFERHDGQAVTCDDFVQCMQDASGIDLSQFKLWYSQAGTPELNASGHYDEAAQSYTLTLSQTIPDTPGQTNKKPMHIPVKVGLLDDNGQDMDEKLLELKDTEQSFVFENISSKPIPSILRGFSAPVNLKADLSDEDLRFLMVHDKDDFNRWDAGQVYARRTLLKLVEAAQKGEPLSLPSEFIDSIRLIISDANMDHALMARALTLPDEDLLGQSMAEIDVDALYTARKFARKTLSQELRDVFLSLYHKHHHTGAFDITPKAMGQRALKNVALSYLAKNMDSEILNLCKTQYDTATNMTDRITPLACLIDTRSEERETASQDFYTRFEGDANVIDKWFFLQAVSDRDDTLDQVKKLTDHPAFTFKNPNRLRSLLGAFAMRNMRHFHRKDGAGYELIKKAIIKADLINPHASTSLFTPFKRWKRYTPDRQEIMKSALDEILAQDNLSPDLYELASKSRNA